MTLEAKIIVNELIYAVVRPPFHVLKTEIPQDQEQYEDLVRAALNKGHELYAASLEEGQYGLMPKMPWALQTINTQTNDLTILLDNNVTGLNELICPYCSKVLRSASGKTLHIKQKHLNHLQAHEHDNMGADSSNS